MKRALIVAIVLGIIGIGLWEFYWRSQGLYPTYDGNEALWSVQRAKIETLDSEGIVFIGSSRIHFDVQLDVWEQMTGKRPIQLANGGSSPLPVFHDLVNNTEFAGTIVVGVTPGIFFSTTDPNSMVWNRPQKMIDYYHKRTYAQRLNHQLSLPLQNSFAFLSESGGVDGINLKELLNKVEYGSRVEPSPMPPFHQFSDISIDRNVRMTERTVTDTAFANTVKKVWQFFDSGNNEPPKKEVTMSFFLNDLEKFNARGGNIILLRCPSTGFYDKIETENLPREEFWDDLVAQTNAPGYHFKDYESLKNFDCPEWSHLSATDADVFTAALVEIMLNDSVLTKQKTN